MKYFHPFYFNLEERKIKVAVSTFFGKLRAKWWRINLGSGCKFNGLPIFRNFPNSSIIIGNGCRFNSSKTSNLIGVFTPCMISALKRDARILIGNNCGFSGTVIGAAQEIIIGDYV